MVTPTKFPGSFPQTRMRRSRQSSWTRALVREAQLSPSDLVAAMILKDGRGVREEIKTLPGVYRLSPDQAVDEARKCADLGIPALALFPYTESKDRSTRGEEATNPDNLMCRTARAIKQAVPDIGLIGDVALDPYTDHGHDGILHGEKIINDETNDALCEQALVLARAGFDVLAPSDMMDGRIKAIRERLEHEMLHDVLLLSYAVKYASCFYGPYRDAIGSSGVLKGDKKTYQMDPANGDEGLREVALDLAEGADWVMVKPGLPYLDMVRRVKDTFAVPTFVFQVSGECAMIEAAAKSGALDRQGAMMESLLCFKRAGADGIITYFATEAAEILARV